MAGPAPNGNLTSEPANWHSCVVSYNLLLNFLDLLVLGTLSVPSWASYHQLLGLCILVRLGFDLVSPALGIV